MSHISALVYTQQGEGFVFQFKRYEGIFDQKTTFINALFGEELLYQILFNEQQS